MANWNANLSGESTPERVQGMQASGEVFKVLGAKAELGRTLEPSDAQPGSARVAVLSHGFWTRHYGGEQGIIGKSVKLNGGPTRLWGCCRGVSSTVWRRMK